MTRDQIRLVQASFRNVLPIREQAAALFYDRLFEIDPGTRGLFADTDLRTQGGKLMGAGTPARQLRGREQALCDGRRRTPVDAAGWAGRSIHSRASRRVGVRLQYAQRKDDGGSHGSGFDPYNNKFPRAAGRGPSRDAWVRKQNGLWSAC
jgi:hypothetical protein